MTSATTTAPILPKVGMRVHFDNDEVPTRWLRRPDGEMWNIIDEGNTLELTRVAGGCCELSITWPGDVTTTLTIPRTDFTSEFFQAA